MSFAPTFGSVGDFIAVCQLATQLTKALGEGHGASSTEYQELRREPLCRYWYMQLSRLERAAMAAKVDRVLEKQDEVQTSVTAQSAALEDLVQQQSQKLEALNKQVVTSFKQISKAAGFINDMLAKIWKDVRHVRHEMSNPPLPRPLDPTKEFPVILEDPLGFHLTVPMGWIKSWEGFYGLLQVRFDEIGKGQQLVRRRQFALENHINGRDIDRVAPIWVSFRPRMKIDMSIVKA
ncbi:hypothetical protein OQA88_10585 [Cercophora sp. LCS_1]